MNFPKYIKVSDYRPNRIIARNPKESGYEIGDDKFPTLLFVEGGMPEIRFAQELCRVWNENSEKTIDKTVKTS